MTEPNPLIAKFGNLYNVISMQANSPKLEKPTASQLYFMVKRCHIALKTRETQVYILVYIFYAEYKL